MKQTQTAREMLAQIEKKYFRGAGLAKACLLEGEERRAYRLAQVERLLTGQHGNLPLATNLSDEFWTADERRGQTEPVNPLLSLKEQQALTDEEMLRLRLILDVAGLCHDLSLHFAFDPSEAFGIRKNDFWASNKELVEWLSTTQYERIAMHTAYVMRKHAINVYADKHYLPAQDALAELFSSEHSELVRQPDKTKIPPRDYVRIILNEMLRIERHWQRGRRLKLEPEVVILHDEIYGVVPRQYDKGVLQAAQELYDYMDREVYGRFMLTDYSYDAASWDEQPEAVRHIVFKVMGRFNEKVREVRSKYLAAGWVTDDSLAFGYLIDHAERCAHGSWRGEEGDL